MTSQTASLANPYNPDKAYFECRPFGMAEFDTLRTAMSRTSSALHAGRAVRCIRRPESWPYWAVGIKKVEWTSPKPFRVGTTRTVTFADGTEVYERFIAWTADVSWRSCSTATATRSGTRRRALSSPGPRPRALPFRVDRVLRAARRICQGPSVGEASDGARVQILPVPAQALVQETRTLTSSSRSSVELGTTVDSCR